MMSCMSRSKAVRGHSMRISQFGFPRTEALGRWQAQRPAEHLFQALLQHAFQAAQKQARRGARDH